jgi:hypothetical protein
MKWCFHQKERPSFQWTCRVLLMSGLAIKMREPICLLILKKLKVRCVCGGPGAWKVSTKQLPALEED